jgi:hypothetical protein
MQMIEQEYYEKYKKIIDQCIPKDVLSRLLSKTDNGDYAGNDQEPIRQDTVQAPWEE